MRERDPLVREPQSFDRVMPIGFWYSCRELQHWLINRCLAAINGILVADHLDRRTNGFFPDVAPRVEL